MTTFNFASIPAMNGQTAIVTGANSGIGLATARALASAGARVVFAVRNLDKGRVAADATPGRTEVRELDLASLASVNRFAREWEGPIDLLINNAAVSGAPKRHVTADGFEEQFGTGHLGHFALTSLLIEQVTGRVVTVSSQAERFGKIDFDDLNWAKKPYRKSRAYGQVKLANLLFSAELQRRLTAAGSAVRAEAAHPGFVATPIYRESGPIAKLMVRTMAQSPEEGALCVLYAAVADLPGDSFAGPSRFMHMRGAPELIGRSATAQDTQLARRLWDVSERLTGTTWPLTPIQSGTAA
jgi:NAD(P)-dependent dehydrogenase (short-subunit alcohol dehydrogenase family)